MTHVFVETNWVVAYAAPAHARVREAIALAQKAASGEVRLYLPSVCLSEARYPIRTKFHPRRPAEAVRNYMAWAMAEGTVRADEGGVARRVLDRYETSVLAELADTEDRLRLLQDHPGIEIFPLSEEMLRRTVDLSTQNLDLKPFDQAILAAVLVRGGALRAEGADEVSFCELDSDLQPWDKNGRNKEPLTGLYNSAGIWVYGDFDMASPPRRMGLPEQ